MLPSPCIENIYIDWKLMILAFNQCTYIWCTTIVRVFSMMMNIIKFIKWYNSTTRWIFLSLYIENIYINRKLMILAFDQYIFSIYDNRKGIFDDDEYHQIHQMIKFDNAMNVTVVVHRKYIHQLKANIISFRSMYICLIYDDGNIHRVDKLYLTFLMHTQKINEEYIFVMMTAFHVCKNPVLFFIFIWKNIFEALKYILGLKYFLICENPIFFAI